ncbi:MAG: SUMF1/EgtB/PvdO family nonheme iron enzyme, partial [Bacteroidota bacterium]
MNSSHLISLPLDSLLVLLERDFELSPDLRLRAQQAIHVWGKDHYDQPERLKYLLAPLFAQNETQQTQFYQTFDQWLKPYLPQDAPGSGPDEPAVLKQARRQWQRPLLATALLLITGILTWIFWPKTEKPLPPPSPHFSASTFCATLDQSIAFTDQTPERQQDSSLRIHWDFGDGSRDSATSNPQHQYRALGSYPVTLTVWRQGRDSSLTQVIHVHDGIPPIATFSYDTLETGELRFRPDSIRPEWRYRWEFGDGTQRATREVTVAVPPETEYEATLVVSLPGDSLGRCSARHTELIDTRQTLVELPKLMPLRLPAEGGELTWTALAFVLWALLCALVWLFTYAWQRYRKRLQPSPDLRAALHEGQAPPIDLPFPNQEELIEESADLMALAETLRQRQEGERERLDLAATLRATVQQGGFPSLRFQRPSRPSEYLALVEMNSPRDQQAKLFTRLLRLLQREQVKLEVWFYQGDPSWCCRHPEAERVSLERIYQLFPRHRLLMFSSGERLLDEQGKTLAPHLRRPLSSWDLRALLTPLPVGDWAARERSLHQHFVLLPADLPGQLSLTEAWAELEEVETFKALKRRLLRQRPDQPADQDYDFHKVADLKEYLGEVRFRWLAAVALYPKPAWDITLALAARLGPAPTVEDLLRLTRVPWLRDGRLTESLRAELVAALDPATEQKARLALRDLLDQTPVTAGSFAAREKHIQLTVQQAFLNPNDREAQAALRLLWEQGLLDAVARGHWQAQQPKEEPAPATTTPRLSQLFQRHRWATMSILLFLVGCLGLVGLAPSGSGWRSLGLAQAQPDSLSWYLNAAGEALTQNDLAQAESYLGQAKRLDSTREELAFQQALLSYRQGRGAYQRRQWNGASLGFNEARSVSIRLDEGDSLRQQARHAQGLVFFYQDSASLAERTADSLPEAFYADFGTPNLATVLGGARLAEQIENLLAQADSLFLLAQRNRQSGLDVEQDWLRVAEGYRGVLAIDPNDPVAVQRMREISQILTGLTQTYEVEGQVVDINSNEPIPGVKVFWTEGQGVTDAEGKFYLSKVYPERRGAPLALVFMAENYFREDRSIPLPSRNELKISLRSRVADYVSITGSVIDRQTGKGLGSVPILIDGEPSGVSDRSGSFSISVVPAELGSRQPRLEVQGLAGYRDFALPLSLGADTTLTIRMQPEQADIPPPRMLRVPGGSFLMGSEEGEDDEKPVHRVEVSTFYLSETEVTNAQFAQFLNAQGNQEEGGSTWYNENGAGYQGYAEAAIQVDAAGQWQVKEGRASHPVNYVSWYGARAYAQWLSSQTGQRYRLPTEAEWEYAAGGGQVDRDSTGKRRFTYSGSEDPDLVAWYTSTTDDTGTRPVGSKRPNGLGLYDMSGNVWVWCSDWYGESYYCVSEVH